MNGEENYPVSLRISQEQDDFLRKINPDNKSDAMRTVLNKYMKQQRTLMFEKYLTTFAFGIILVGIGSIITHLVISFGCIITGVFMIGYSLWMYVKGRIRYEKGGI